MSIVASNPYSIPFGLFHLTHVKMPCNNSIFACICINHAGILNMSFCANYSLPEMMK